MLAYRLFIHILILKNNFFSDAIEDIIGIFAKLLFKFILQQTYLFLVLLFTYMLNVDKFITYLAEIGNLGLEICNLILKSIIFFAELFALYFLEGYDLFNLTFQPRLLDPLFMLFIDLYF